MQRDDEFAQSTRAAPLSGLQDVNQQISFHLQALTNLVTQQLSSRMPALPSRIDSLEPSAIQQPPQPITSIASWSSQQQQPQPPTYQRSPISSFSRTSPTEQLSYPIFNQFTYDSSDSEDVLPRPIYSNTTIQQNHSDSSDDNETSLWYTDDNGEQEQSSDEQHSDTGSFSSRDQSSITTFDED